MLSPSVPFSLQAPWNCGVRGSLPGPLASRVGRGQLQLQEGAALKESRSLASRWASVPWCPTQAAWGWTRQEPWAWPGLPPTGAHHNALPRDLRMSEALEGSPASSSA